MRQELKGVTTTLIPQRALRLRTPPVLYNPPTVDIAVISAIAFHFNIYQKDNKVFIISLYKINRIINKREEKLIKETNKELVKYFLPTIYTKYKDVFLRVASDKLPPYQTYNYKI